MLYEIVPIVVYNTLTAGFQGRRDGAVGRSHNYNMTALKERGVISRTSFGAKRRHFVRALRPS
jgi:hypothetical protein